MGHGRMVGGVAGWQNGGPKVSPIPAKEQWDENLPPTRPR